MSNPKEIDYNSAMLRLTLENNALLKTILHYAEKTEASRLNVPLEDIENFTDDLITNNMAQAMEELESPED